jgi:hypothetical protein
MIKLKINKKILIKVRNKGRVRNILLEKLAKMHCLLGIISQRNQLSPKSNKCFVLETKIKFFLFIKIFK